MTPGVRASHGQASSLGLLSCFGSRSCLVCKYTQFHSAVIDYSIVRQGTENCVHLQDVHLENKSVPGGSRPWVDVISTSEPFKATLRPRRQPEIWSQGSGGA